MKFDYRNHFGPWGRPPTVEEMMEHLSWFFGAGDQLDPFQGILKSRVKCVLDRGEGSPMDCLAVRLLGTCLGSYHGQKLAYSKRKSMEASHELEVEKLNSKINRLKMENELLRGGDKGEFALKNFILQNSLDYVREGAPVVYFLCKEGEVVYVGKTKRLESRLDAHSKKKDFDSYFHIGVEENEMDAVEVHYIKLLKPKLNVAHLK